MLSVASADVMVAAPELASSGFVDSRSVSSVRIHLVPREIGLGEDQSSDVRRLAQELSASGQTHIACDATQRPLAGLRSLPPDLILLDSESATSVPQIVAHLADESQQVTVPIVVLASAAQSDAKVVQMLEDGASAVLRPPFVATVVLAQLRSLARLQRRLDHALELSVRDELTGLYNRRFFFERIDQELARARRTQACLGLILLDLDGFKPINDLLGHPVGDALLERLAQELLGCTRKSDVLARMGGDEFALLLIGNSPDGLRICADKLCRHVAAIDFHLPDDLHLTASFGLSAWSEQVDSRERLIETADRALLRAKSKGGNCVEIARAPTQLKP